MNCILSSLLPGKKKCRWIPCWITADSLRKSFWSCAGEILKKESYLKLHVSLMQATAQYCIPQGYYREGAQCIEKALKSNVLTGDDPKEKIRCLRFLIYQQINLWEMEHTEEYLEESLLLSEKNGLSEDYAITCRLYGLYLTMKGRFEQGMEYLKKSLEFFM